MIELRPRSYGGAKVPEAKELEIRLHQLPTKFSSARIQALIARDVSNAIASEMEKKGIQINKELVDRAHLARPMFRHIGAGMAQGLVATQEVRHTKFTEQILKRKYNSPKLASMLSKWYATGHGEALRYLKAEDIAFLVGGFMMWGWQRPDSSWKHIVMTPAAKHRLHENMLRRYRLQVPGGPLKNERYKVNGKTRDERHAAYERHLAHWQPEDASFIKLQEWLESNGINLQAIARRINRNITQGNYA